MGQLLLHLVETLQTKRFRGALLLCLGFQPIFAAYAAEPYFRLVGTNLYDFGPVLLSKTNRSPFVVYGKVVSIGVRGVTLERAVPSRYVMNPGVNPTLLDTGEMLQWLYMAKLCERDVSFGEFLALSPQMRRLVVPRTEAVDVLQYSNPCEPGDFITITALPLRTPPDTRITYAYGVPVAPPVTNFAVLYRVLPDRIVPQYLGPSPLTVLTSNRVARSP